MAERFADDLVVEIHPLTVAVEHVVFPIKGIEVIADPLRSLSARHWSADQMYRELV